MEDIKIGDRIDIYEILNDGNYPEGMFTAGTWRMGKPNEDTVYGRLGTIRSDRAVLNPNWLTMWIKESGSNELNARKVGTMIVKKLK